MPDYKIVVRTGVNLNAGTDADVFITLIGSNDTSEEFRLDDTNNNDFEQGDIGEYNFHTAKSLGDLRKIRIKHNNSGDRPGWFLDYINVREVSSGKTWYFHCSRWLANDEDDRRRVRILDKQIDIQIGWRFCKKCQALVYGDGGSSGSCAAGGQHDTNGSFNYALAYDSPSVGQRYWKHCNKCHALAYAGTSFTALGNGVCPSGGKHNHYKSFDYALRANTAGLGQSNWRYCKKCQGLTFAGGGKCAAGGTHDFKDSSDYRIDKEKYRVRIEAQRVHCGNTEDDWHADSLYLVGGFSDGTVSKGVLTSPISINNKQEKYFNASQRVCFDAEVPMNGIIRGTIKAYDEDFAKDWAKYGEMVTKISNGIAQGLKSLKDPRAVTAGEILGYVTQAFNIFAPLDKDDDLGTAEYGIPVYGSQNEEIDRHFQETGALGFSTWNYNIIVTVNRT